MQKNFYASGFLYHSPSQQILLHQSNKIGDKPVLWSMIEGKGRQGEEPRKTFQRIVQHLLDVKLPLDQIYAVYDYDDAQDMGRFVFYAEIEDLAKVKLPNEQYSWLTFKQTLKLPFSQQTKQDIIVAERVIKAGIRKLEADAAVAAEALVDKA